MDRQELDKRGPYSRERRRQLEKQGVYPPRVILSKRLNVWLRSEIEAWENARAAGATDDQVRQLIRDMVAARAQLMPAKAAA